MSKYYITTIMTSDGVIHKWFINELATEPNMVIYDNEILDTMEFDDIEQFNMFKDMFTCTTTQIYI